MWDGHGVISGELLSLGCGFFIYERGGTINDPSFIFIIPKTPKLKKMASFLEVTADPFGYKI